jgi:hypothetical protein
MGPHDTLEQLRADIDSGRTGDKVSAPDPAMAPLGTDDDAAGKPPSPASIALTRRLENSHPHQSETQTGLGHAWILIAIVIAVAAAIPFPAARARRNAPVISDNAVVAPR